jgi:hypothetical protein
VKKPCPETRPSRLAKRIFVHAGRAAAKGWRGQAVWRKG